MSLNNITEITGEKILEYLTDVWNNQAVCEICGKDSWIILSTNAHPSALLNVINPTAGLASMGFMFYPVSCEECGNTKLIRAETVMKYLSKKNQDNAENGSQTNS